jgi:hypothetical protein
MTSRPRICLLLAKTYLHHRLMFSILCRLIGDASGLRFGQTIAKVTSTTSACRPRLPATAAMATQVPPSHLAPSSPPIFNVGLLKGNINISPCGCEGSARFRSEWPLQKPLLKAVDATSARPLGSNPRTDGRPHSPPSPEPPGPRPTSPGLSARRGPWHSPDRRHRATRLNNRRYVTGTRSPRCERCGGARTSAYERCVRGRRCWERLGARERAGRGGEGGGGEAAREPRSTAEARRGATGARGWEGAAAEEEEEEDDGDDDEEEEDGEGTTGSRGIREAHAVRSITYVRGVSDTS